MAEITIDVGSEINERDIAIIRKRLHTIKGEDQLSIRMEAADAHQADGIIDELEKHGFDYQPKGGHEGEYYIIAQRRRK